MPRSSCQVCTQNGKSLAFVCTHFRYSMHLPLEASPFLWRNWFSAPCAVTGVHVISHGQAFTKDMQQYRVHSPFICSCSSASLDMSMPPMPPMPPMPKPLKPSSPPPKPLRTNTTQGKKVSTHQAASPVAQRA